jgi:hypothetical protein
MPGDEWNIEAIPDNAPQAVKDYLASLDDAAFGAASPVTPKFVSPSDLATQWTGALRGPAFFAYATNYLIDTDNAIIVDVEAMARQSARLATDRAKIDHYPKLNFNVGKPIKCGHHIAVNRVLSLQSLVSRSAQAIGRRPSSPIAFGLPSERFYVRFYGARIWGISD